MVPANTTRNIGVLAQTKQGVWSEVKFVTQTSLESGTGAILRELIGVTDTSAKFEFIGNLDCSMEANWRAKIFRDADKTLVFQYDDRITRGVDGNFKISPVTFGGLVPNTRYYLEVGISTKPGYWVGVQSGGNRYFTTNPKSTTGTSSVIYIVSTDSWSDDQIIIAYSLSGSKFTGTKIQLKNSLPSDQIFIFTVEKNQKLEVIKTNPASL